MKPAGGISHSIKTISLIFISCLLLVSQVPEIHAGMRCGARLVSPGDTSFQVLSKCGEPDYRTVRYEKRIRRDFYRDLFPDNQNRYQRERNIYREPLLVEEYVKIEEWVYNLGPSSFVRYLVFENEVLVDIVTGDYGF